MNGINEFSPLYCSAEWHIEQHCPALSAHIYTIAFRISSKSGRFCVSYPQLASYFKTTPARVGRACRALRDIGFFNLLSHDDGHQCVYAPMKHTEWAVKYPGQCTEKVEFAWGAEGDLLGRELFAICDGRIKFFYPNVLLGMRNTGMSDLEIVAAMKKFRQIDEPVDGNWTEGFVGRFMNYLKSKPEIYQ